MKHDTREPVKAPAHPLPENTSARPPGNLQLTLTHARHTRTARHGSGRAGETLPQEPETDREPPQNSRTCTEFGPRAVRASRYRHRQDGQTFGVPLHRDRRLGVRASAGVQRDSSSFEPFYPALSDGRGQTPPRLLSGAKKRSGWPPEINAALFAAVVRVVPLAGLLF
ncbi:receptor-type tyrosine- phosphatase mu [Labeo rohita]|uniref:Receptor-type tyrosine-phosphatase mu n=1 Tax=Labeo rohita TaxID=84645 RepID=A0A498MT21_LABRO|nr:receptor-type tyrosine- phosphatase mu [Labeo rohita]